MDLSAPSRNTGKTFSIRMQLFTNCVILLLLLAVGLASMIQARIASRKLQQEMQTTSELISLIHLSGTCQVHFKRQVQEWKNLLLRGASTDSREHYWNAFLHNESIVQREMEALIAQMEAIPLSAENARAFLELHQKSGEQYRAAYQQLLASDGRDFLAADQSIRGIDRTPDEMIDKLVRSIMTGGVLAHQEAVNSALQRQNEDKRMARFVSICLLIGIAVCVINAYIALRSNK